MLHRRLSAITLEILSLAIAHAQPPGYTTGEACAECHHSISETYSRTGMARSFFRPTAGNTVEDYSGKNTFYHQASDSYFTMLMRDGKYYQRRYQLDADRKPVNVMEKQIDYILGSGNHVRSYVSRTARNTLVELPLAWYTEKGGYWGMNPGYDRPNHDGFRREITYDCMFCHNAYPRIPASHDQPFAEPVYTGALPEGIDCQRCHGPGAKHVQLAKAAGPREGIRSAIVNPARLSAQRQMEVCMECHLETTSFPLPNSIQRYDRGPFSYRPGEPLTSFMLFFDHSPGTGHDDKFEIVNAAYRLRRSACFLRSQGKLGCTTCHNPHDIPRGEVAVQHYNGVCRQCHSGAFDRLVASARHTRETGCIDCHMPKRRTDDVVHVVMTDHYIQRRRPARNLLAELTERHESDGDYHGKVVPCYPAPLPQTPDNDLYLAIAQVIQRSNLSEGIAQLTAAITRHPPQRAEPYFELAEALRNNGQLAKALPLYEEAIRHDPQFVVGLQKQALALRRSGKFTEAEHALTQAVSAAPDNPNTWRELGLTCEAQKKTGEAIAAFQKAIELDPDMPEAHNNLGVLWSATGDATRAETAFREAIRIQPDYADAHGNLANLLSAKGDPRKASEQFEIALRLQPDDAVTRYNYAMALGRMQRFDDAQRQLEESLRADPQLADAHQLLGDLLMAKARAREALPHYREAVRMRPESGRAHLGMGTALAGVGDVANAVPHLQKAAADPDPAIREEASQVLRQLGKP